MGQAFVKDNLYKLWNRMSSGSYFPPPVMRVEIPKGDGRMRPLGIPTVSDRIAQQIVKQQLEPELEKHFHPDSYGYRPEKSALDAVGKARENCWKYDWVLDLDIKGFFDNIDHDLLMKAVRHHTDDKWVLLYIERWLKAPVMMTDHTLFYPKKGTPQGGVISPLLANLFLHYAFDNWMERQCPTIPFERYADDAVCHCKSLAQAEYLFRKLNERMENVGLELHPEKTKIVYCKDTDRQKDYALTSFDFLGYTFRTRKSKNRWGKFGILHIPIKVVYTFWMKPLENGACVRKCKVLMKDAENSSLIFLLLSAIKQQKQFGKPHESGIGPGAVTRAWKIYPICSILSFKAGLTTMAGFINLHSTRP
nr:group II intron reverse transcriptase/maturase [Desulfobacter latus]